MNEEVKRALDELRALIGKNVDAVTRINAIEEAAKQRDADNKKILDEIETLRGELKKREDELKEIRQAARLQMLQGDPAKSKERGLAILGMQIRAGLCVFMRSEIPAQFRAEVDELKAYREQRATLQAGSGEGLNVIPTITSTSIIDSLEEVSDVMSRVDLQPDLPGKMLIPVITGRPQLQPKRANIANALAQQDPGIGQLAFDPNEAGFLLPVDNRLIQMSAVALGTLVSGLITDGVAQGMADWLILADGSANYNAITGILAEATARYVVTMPAGKKSFADLTKADLTRVKANNLKRGRGPRATWMHSVDIMGLMEDMDRQGKVPVCTYTPDGMARCLMNPCIIEEAMPDLADDAVNKAFLGYGDLATFLVGLVGGIQIGVSTEYLFGQNQTAFRAIVNMDMKRKPSATYTILKTAAA